MTFNFKHLLKIASFSIFFILLGCQLQEPTKNHGILFLDNRSEKLTINKSNKNDVIEILGQPHAKNFNEEDIWIYIERTLTKGKYHKLGRHELKSNNTLVLNFDKFLLDQDRVIRRWNQELQPLHGGFFSKSN